MNIQELKIVLEAKKAELSVAQQEEASVEVVRDLEIDINGLEYEIEELENEIEDLKTELEVLEAELLVAQKAVNDFELDERNYEESYKEMIDECNKVEIFGMSWRASRVLEEFDPSAYACGLSDYIDSLDKEDNEDYQALVEAVENLESEIDDLEIEIDALENEAE